MFLCDDKQLTSAFWDNMIWLWNSVTKALSSTFEGHLDEMMTVTFLCNSKQLTSVSDNKTVWLWDLITKALSSTLEGHLSWVMIVTFLCDDKQLALTFWDNTIWLWKSVTERLPQIFNVDSVIELLFFTDMSYIKINCGQIQLKPVLSNTQSQFLLLSLWVIKRNWLT